VARNGGWGQIGRGQIRRGKAVKVRRGKTGSDTEWNGEAVTARLGFAGLRMARRLGHVRVGSGPAG
jgi:hypothetical protein